MAFLKEYEKLKVIGKGSFAKIWKVRHLKYGYVRAIKVLNEMVDDEDDPAYRTFVEECKVLLQIGSGSHPNIVHIYQPRLMENRAIVEMDYVEGETLNEYLHRVQYVPIDEVYRFIDEIVSALAYCHYDIYKFLMDPEKDNLDTDPTDGSKYIIDEETEKRLVREYGVTHNDLHSNNVMRRSYDGHYVLLDFGLAIQNGKAVKSSSRRGGALEYMSPEKFDDSSVISTQSDVYSLGILLYEILAGRVPFVLDEQLFESSPTTASHQLMTAHKTAFPPDLKMLRREAFLTAFPNQEYENDCPDWLEEVVIKCLAKNPAQRYANAKELLDDINRHRATADPITDTGNKNSEIQHLKNKNQLLNNLLSTVQHDLETARTDVERLKTLNSDLANKKPTVQVKTVEKIVEKPVEKIVYKQKGSRGWIIATVFFILTTIAALGGLGYMAYLYEEAEWQLQQNEYNTPEDTTATFDYEYTTEAEEAAAEELSDYEYAIEAAAVEMPSEAIE